MPRAFAPEQDCAEGSESERASERGVAVQARASAQLTRGLERLQRLELPHFPKQASDLRAKVTGLQETL